MISADPMFEAGAAVYVRLSTDGPLVALLPGGIWSQRAPVDIDEYPLLTFNLLPGRTDYTMTGPWRHAFDLRITFLDKGEDDAAILYASDQVLRLLTDPDDADLPMVHHDVLYCRRQTVNQTSPVREGDQFQQIIHQYRLEVKPV